MNGLEASLAAYLGELVGRACAILGDALTGVWLIGSAAAGGYEAGISDVDVATAVERPLAEGETKLLAQRLSHQAIPCPGRKLELVIYQRSALAGPTEGLALELNFNSGAGMTDVMATDIAAGPSHWFLLDLTMARERSVALTGPELSELLGPIPREAIVAALRTSLDWFETAEPDRGSVVLAACRAWRYAETGLWGTKADAAEWAARAAPALAGTIGCSLALRRGAQIQPLRQDEVVTVVERARRALSESG